MGRTFKDTIGISDKPAQAGQGDDPLAKEYINLKLAARGYAIVGDEADYPFLEMGRSLIQNFQERLRLLKSHRCPADRHISQW